MSAAEEVKGLPEAWKAFERTRDRADCDAVPVLLNLVVDPSGTKSHGDLSQLEFGMQDRAGNLLTGSPQDGKLLFAVGVIAKRNRASGEVRYVGPFANGPTSDEFLYLSWRRPDTAEWTMRIKMPLTTLTWEQVSEADQKQQAFHFDATGREPHDRRKVGWEAH